MLTEEKREQVRVCGGFTLGNLYPLNYGDGKKGKNKKMEERRHLALHQRPSKRGSESKSIGTAMRIRLKSACSGFKRKFVSAGLMALGKASTAERRRSFLTKLSRADRVDL
jgi:hypothetical protein